MRRVGSKEARKYNLKVKPNVTRFAIPQLVFFWKTIKRKCPFMDRDLRSAPASDASSAGAKTRER